MRRMAGRGIAKQGCSPPEAHRHRPAMGGVEQADARAEWQHGTSCRGVGRCVRSLLRANANAYGHGTNDVSTNYTDENDATRQGRFPGLGLYP